MSPSRAASGKGSARPRDAQRPDDAARSERASRATAKADSSGGPVRLPPALPRDAHKGQAGRVLCVCGSREMPGAAILVVRAAQRAGAGLVQLACLDPELLALVPVAAPEAVLLELSAARPAAAAERVLAQRADALVVGPGLGNDARARAFVEALLERGQRAGPQATPALVIDADGLNALAGAPQALAQWPVELALTPHPGEAARLLGRVLGSSDGARASAARELAGLSGGACVLKGASTCVAAGARCERETRGNPGMATAGSGDVLAGVLGAYLARARAQAARGYGAFEAARAAVHVHARAGDLAAHELGERGLIASDLIEWLPRAQLAAERTRAR